MVKARNVEISEHLYHGWPPDEDISNEISVRKEVNNSWTLGLELDSAPVVVACKLEDFLGRRFCISTRDAFCNF